MPILLVPKEVQIRNHETGFLLAILRLHHIGKLRMFWRMADGKWQVVQPLWMAQQGKFHFRAAVQTAGVGNGEELSVEQFLLWQSQIVPHGGTAADVAMLRHRLVQAQVLHHLPLLQTKAATCAQGSSGLCSDLCCIADRLSLHLGLGTILAKEHLRPASSRARPPLLVINRLSPFQTNQGLVLLLDHYQQECPHPCPVIFMDDLPTPILCACYS